MDLNNISKKLNDDCLHNIYSFINREKLVYDFLEKKKDNLMTKFITQQPSKQFKVGYYYTRDWGSTEICYIEKRTKCFLNVKITEPWYSLKSSEDCYYKKFKIRVDKDGNEYISTWHELKVSESIESDKPLLWLTKLLHRTTENSIVNYPIDNTLYKHGIDCTTNDKGICKDYSRYTLFRKNVSEFFRTLLLAQQEETIGDFDWLILDFRMRSCDDDNCNRETLLNYGVYYDKIFKRKLINLSARMDLYLLNNK